MKSFINFLPPWVETNIQPAFYDKESGSVLQQTARMYAKVNQLVRHFNCLAKETKETVDEYIAKFVELKDFVDDYFDNLDVQEEINNKLDSMVEDGTLATLFEQSVGAKTTTIGFTRLMRELIPNTNHENFSVSDYPIMQGGCYVTNNVFVQCSIRSDDNTNAQLRVINLGTGSVERSAILPLMHANSVAYNPETNKLYVASLVQDTTNQPYLYVVDYATLTLEDTIEFENLGTQFGVHSVSYDYVTGKTVIATEHRGDNELKFYYLNLEDKSLTEIQLENYHNLIVNGSLHSWANNDICVHNNILYLLKHSPNAIVTFNLATGKCIYVYNAQLYLRYGVYVGELESISVNPETEDFYLSCYHNECTDGWNNIFNYVLTNFQHGVECNNLLHGETSEIYVNANSTAIDPTGTSGKPYKTIAEALERLNDNRQQQLTMYLSKGTYPFVSLSNNKDVRIRPATTTEVDQYIVKGIKANGGRFFTTAITINGTGDYDVELERSEATITACTVDSTKTSNIYMYNSTLHTYNIKDENAVFAKIKSASESTLDCHEGVPAYTLQNQIPTLTKAVAIATGYSSIGASAVSKSYEGKETMVESGNNNLFFWLTSQAGFVKIPFEGATSTESNTSRYCSGVSGGKMCRFQIVMNPTAKTVAINTQSVIDLSTTTPSDAKSNTAFSGGLFIENNH
jgi:hypothetical protein